MHLVCSDFIKCFNKLLKLSLILKTNEIFCNDKIQNNPMYFHLHTTGLNAFHQR